MLGIGNRGVLIITTGKPPGSITPWVSGLSDRTVEFKDRQFSAPYVRSGGATMRCFSSTLSINEIAFSNSKTLATEYPCGIQARHLSSRCHPLMTPSSTFMHGRLGRASNLKAYRSPKRAISQSISVCYRHCRAFHDRPLLYTMLPRGRAFAIIRTALHSRRPWERRHCVSNLQYIPL